MKTVAHGHHVKAPDEERAHTATTCYLGSVATLHFPPRADWPHAEPDSLGFDSAALAQARNYAETSEIDWPVDVGGMVAKADPPPYNRILGPTKPRGPTSGLVVKNGLVAAEWGTPERVDMTFSATKSYLWTCLALAVDRGLIRRLDDPVAAYVENGNFTGAHNRRITWRHLLEQTSEWSGTLFGIPDTVDHNRSVNQANSTGRKGEARPLQSPGTFWEDNDVRVNALALAALHVWRTPLPELLRREVMDRIGASDSWRWHAYANAKVDIGGQTMASVPGGAPLGRRPLDQRLRPRPLRLADARPGQLERPARCFRSQRRSGADAVWPEPALRSPVVAERRPQGVVTGIGTGLRRPRRRGQHGVHRS